MKRILPLLLLFLAFAACTESVRHAKALEEAEALLGSRPETALRMLDSIGREEGGMGRAERMRWQLLRLTAQNKCYVPFKSDSAALEVTGYYDRHGTPNERMAAHYLLGCVYRDLRKPQNQLQAFHQAIESADTAATDCDIWTLSRVYSQMAELFYLHLMPTQQKEALQKAYHYTILYGDTLAATYEMQQLSWVYDRMNMPDSVIYYSKKGYELFSRYGKKAEAAQALGMSIHAQLQLGNYKEAANALAIYEGESGRFDSQHEVAPGHELYYHDKGFYYLETGRADSAETCFRKEIKRATDLSGLHAGYTGLRELFKRRGTADSTAKYAVLSEAFNDSLHARANTDQLQLMQSLFDYSQHQLKSRQMEHEAYKMRMQNRMLLLGGLLAVCALCLIVPAIKHRVERKHRQLKAEIDRQHEINTHYAADLQTSEQNIRCLKEDINEKNTLIKQLKEEKKDTIDLLLNQMQVLRRSKEDVIKQIREAIIDDKIFKYLNDLLRNGPQEIEEWNKENMLPETLYDDMEEVFDREFPAFGDIIRNNGNISQAEYVNCMMLWLGYKANDICKICCQTPSANSMLRKRLYTKITGKSGTSKNLDELLHNITP